MLYTDIYSDAKSKGAYITHIAGDTSGFRYPHLELFSGCFDYDKELRTFLFTGNEEDLRKFVSEDITLHEFLSPMAKRIHAGDMAGCPCPSSEKEMAMEAVIATYKNRENIFRHGNIRVVRLADLKVREEFSFIRELYAALNDIPIMTFSMEESGFPFGSVLKGTNILVTDKSFLNLGQDLVHMLFHLQEGIPGFHNDNLYVQELWAPVPELYALQLEKGRMARRARLRKSPHDIHFQDYIFLRAYLGQWLEPESEAQKNDVFHPIYAFLEPALQFIFMALRTLEPYEKNRIIAEAVLCDRTEALIHHFDEYFGNGSFSDIYGTYSIFDKYMLAQKYMTSDEAENIMFHSPHVLPVSISGDDVTDFWRKRLDENFTDLPAGLLYL